MCGCLELFTFLNARDHIFTNIVGVVIIARVSILSILGLTYLSQAN
jgi:hypothetical protein